MEFVPTLPSDVWRLILRIGVETERLDHVDLCSLAIADRQFDQITQDRALWATLLSRDFPFTSRCMPPSKTLYKKRHNMKRLLERTEPMTFSGIWIPSYEELNAYDMFQLLPMRSYNEQFLSFPRITFGSSSGDDISHSPISLSAVALDFLNDTIGDVGHVLPLHEERDPIFSRTSQPRSRNHRNGYNRNKRKKHFDKSSRPKVIPSSKSYISMNRPPRSSMPRKI